MMTFFVQENEIRGLQPFLLDAMGSTLDPSLWFVAGASHPCRGGAQCGQNFCWGSSDMALPTQRIFAILGRSCPASNFSCGVRGVFGVHRDAIHSLSSRTYSALLQLTLDTRAPPPLVGCSYGPHSYGNGSTTPTMGAYYGHALERLWPSVFGPCPDP